MVAGASAASPSFQAAMASSRGVKSTYRAYSAQHSGFSSSTRWSWPWTRPASTTVTMPTMEEPSVTGMAMHRMSRMIVAEPSGTSRDIRGSWDRVSMKFTII